MRPRIALLGTLVIGLVAAETRAEPPGMAAPTPSRKDPVSRKSPALALGLGVGVTAAGVVGTIAAARRDSSDATPLLFAAAVTWVGPSFGRWYGGGSAALGLMVRAMGGALMVYAINERPIDGGCFPDEEDCTAYNDAVAKQERREKIVLVSGATLAIGATIYDFVRAPLDAREFNREHAVTVAPTVMPGAQGPALVPGLALSGRF